MNKQTYTSAIKKTPYKYPIAKKIARLMIEGLDRNSIYHKCFDENYIEIESSERRREITNVVLERLYALDDFLLNEFYNGDVDTSKFILVYAIAKKDVLFFEFLFEKYRDALMSDRDYLSVEDFEHFFKTKSESNLVVASWGEHTISCLTKGYRNILVDSGLGVRSRRNIVAKHLMIHPAVEDHIRLIGDANYLKAMLGGE